MTKELLTQLIENKGILYIYKIPCSLNNDYQYIIIGDVSTKYIDYDCYFTKDDWFTLMQSGSLLPYVCATIERKGKVKEEVNIYDKPNLLKTRKYILTTKLPAWRVYQESQWALQILTEFKVNRLDVFKNLELNESNVQTAVTQFLCKIEPMYSQSIANRIK